MIQGRVAIEKLSKQFTTWRGTVDVLGDISLTVEPGELFVLLGPSGCGKSTLLNLIAGLEKPTGGVIRIGERVVADPASGVFLMPFERDVAMVFQSYALYPHMTVEKNIAFPLSNLKRKLPPEEVSKRVRATAELLKIETLLDRKPSELSGGQRQRVAIGRALVREPRLFLLDEPLSNLDAQLRTDMRAQLKALQRRLGITTLYVTHDQVEAMTLGDRIAIVNQGTIEQMGTPIDIYDNPATPFVARFIGSPPMNVLAGVLDNDTLVLDGLRVALPQPVAATLRAQAGATHTIGVRPEHVALGAPGEGNCEMDIEVVENIGGEFLVYLQSGGMRLVARTKQAPIGSRVSATFDPGRVHVFSPAA
jgi:multiple sugar transport system ATP-binding protein